MNAVSVDLKIHTEYMQYLSLLTTCRFLLLLFVLKIRIKNDNIEVQQFKNLTILAQSYMIKIYMRSWNEWNIHKLGT